MSVLFILKKLNQFIHHVNWNSFIIIIIILL